MHVHIEQVPIIRASGTCRFLQCVLGLVVRTDFLTRGELDNDDIELSAVIFEEDSYTIRLIEPRTVSQQLSDCNLRVLKASASRIGPA